MRSVLGSVLALQETHSGTFVMPFWRPNENSMVVRGIPLAIRLEMGNIVSTDAPPQLRRWLLVIHSAVHEVLDVCAQGIHDLGAANMELHLSTVTPIRSDPATIKPHARPVGAFPVRWHTDC